MPIAIPNAGSFILGGRMPVDRQTMTLYGAVEHNENTGTVMRVDYLRTTEEECEELLENLQDDAAPGVYYLMEEYEVVL